MIDSHFEAFGMLTNLDYRVQEKFHKYKIKYSTLFQNKLVLFLSSIY